MSSLFAGHHQGPLSDATCRTRARHPTSLLVCLLLGSASGFLLRDGGGNTDHQVDVRLTLYAGIPLQRDGLDGDAERPRLGVNLRMGPAPDAARRSPAAGPRPMPDTGSRCPPPRPARQGRPTPRPYPTQINHALHVPGRASPRPLVSGLVPALCQTGPYGRRKTTCLDCPRSEPRLRWASGRRIEPFAWTTQLSR